MGDLGRNLLWDDWSQKMIVEFDTARDEDSVITHPTFATEQAREFYKTSFQCLKLLIHLVDVSVFSDNAALVAKKINDGELGLPKGFDPFVPIESTPGLFQRRMKFLSDDLIEMLVTRICDNFTVYMSEIVREALKSRPEMLRSKEMISFEVALSFDSITQLQVFIIDRKVNELAYLGFQKLAEWLSSRLGIPDLKNLPSFGAISHLIEIRNCIVHNRGRVSSKYLQSSFALKSLNDGEKMRLSVNEIYVVLRATCEAVAFLDGEIAPKFSIQQDSF